jgi:hypothetical protein
MTWECLYRLFLNRYNIRNQILKFCSFFSIGILNLFNAFSFQKQYFRMPLHSNFNIIVCNIIFLYRVTMGRADQSLGNFHVEFCLRRSVLAGMSKTHILSIDLRDHGF